MTSRFTPVEYAGPLPQVSGVLTVSRGGQHGAEGPVYEPRRSLPHFPGLTQDTGIIGELESGEELRDVPRPRYTASPQRVDDSGPR
ncbi:MULTISPECIES: hypothetical protein [Actinoplanes]|uniref:hypothetical protein n=1 Tax=Actinoplanes TaxID=1865 RepID=UPI0012F8A6A7|nr:MULTISPECIES: hypothetical protein [Actinoplanes]